MNESARIGKNENIKKTLQETRFRHASMRPVVIEMKLDLKCLNKTEQEKLWHYFTQCRWLCNYLISLSGDDFKTFNTKTRDIASLDKDGNPVSRCLAMPAKFIQSVYSSLKQDMAALAAKRDKTGKKNGCLKFRSSYDSIDLNQYGNTHWICYGSDGNRNGKYRNTVHIAGIRRPIRVFGMEQIPKESEYANAKLMKRPSGIYLKLTCYIPKHEGDAKPGNKPDIGLDFGIKTTITTSEGEKYDISVREPERLKGLQKKLARQKKGSRGWYDTRHLIRREYEKLANKRRAKANQVYHDITKGRKLIVIQNENIKGWHKGLFGRQVQNSALGTLKSKLVSNPNVLVIDRFFPSTKMCPSCGVINEGITLSDRVFACGCGYTEDRDVKAAKTMLLAGRHIIMSCTRTEHTGTPEERKLDFNTSYEIWKLSYDVTSVKYQFLLLLFLVCHVIMYFQTLQAD